MLFRSNISSSILNLKKIQDFPQKIEDSKIERFNDPGDKTEILENPIFLDKNLINLDSSQRMLLNTMNLNVEERKNDKVSINEINLF